MARRKSTNVRTIISHLALQTTAALAPASVERWALARFATPARARHDGPRPPGLPGHRFELGHHTGALAAWDFGHRATGSPTVLLVHGWSGHASQMEAFVPVLVAAGYHVVCFDQPAHGQSAGRRTNMLEFRDAVLAFARRMGPLAGVVAHSLGATATLLALDRGLRAERVVLVAPPIDPFPFVRGFAAHVGLPAARTEALEQRLRAFLRADLGDRYAVEAAAAASRPLLVVHDQEDRAVPFAHGRLLAGASSHAELWPVSGLGHNRVLADPSVVAGAVQFLRTGRTPAAQRMVEQLSFIGHMAPVEQTLQPSSTSPSQSSSTMLPHTSSAVG